MAATAFGHYLFRDNPLPPAFVPGALPASSLVGVVFTGAGDRIYGSGDDRVYAGLELYFTYQISRLVISGVGKMTIEQLVRVLSRGRNSFLQDIILDPNSTTTADNASYTGALVELLNDEIVVLIDSDNHQEAFMARYQAQSS